MSKGTTHRTVRIEDGLWEAAKAKADSEGLNLSEVIRNALKAYIQESDEVVEAAARRVWVTDGELMRNPRPDWDECAKDPAWKGVMDETREVARSILDAASHILATTPERT